MSHKAVHNRYYARMYIYTSTMSRSTDAYATCNTKLNTHSTAHLARTWIFLLIRFFIYACSNGLFIYHCFSAFSAFWQANYLLNVDFLTTSSYCWLLLLLGARRIKVCIVSERPCTRYHFYLELGRVLQGLYCRAEWLELVNSKIDVMASFIFLMHFLAMPQRLLPCRWTCFRRDISRFCRAARRHLRTLLHGWIMCKPT